MLEIEGLSGKEVSGVNYYCLAYVSLLQTLLKTTNKLLAGDLHTSLSHLKSQTNLGLAPKWSRCAVCHRQYSDETFSGQRDDVALFRLVRRTFASFACVSPDRIAS